MSRFHTVLTAAACALASPLAAQPADQPAEPPTFVETIDVRVVNVEVVVTDRQGNRVTGLGPEDLILTVDGRRVPIDYFTAVHGGVAVAAEDGAEPAVPGMSALTPGEQVGTSYLVFIDDWFAIRRDRNRVLRELAKDLSNLGPGDRMAVVAFDGRRVEMLSSWSGSQSELERVFTQAMERDAHGLQRVAHERAFETGFRPRGRGRTLEVDEVGYANDVRARVTRAVDAAVAAMRGFAQAPGRKVMLLLSGGWPFSPAAYAVDDPQRMVFTTGYGPRRRLYQPLTDAANLLGYTLYPVDVPGMTGVVVDGFRSAAPGRSLVATSQEREGQFHSTLSHLADQTGGRPLINTLRTKALAEVAADTRSYYWIGFIPDRSHDQTFHRIRVEVAGRGLDVRTRAGFRDLSRRVENDMAVESALLFGETSGDGALMVEVGDPVRESRGFLLLPVTVEIPAEGLTFLPDRGGWTIARLELRVMALDRREQTSDVTRIPVVIRRKRQPPAGEAIFHTARLRLRNQGHEVVLSLHDPIAGTSLTTRIAVPPARR